MRDSERLCVIFVMSVWRFGGFMKVYLAENQYRHFKTAKPTHQKSQYTKEKYDHSHFSILLLTFLRTESRIGDAPYRW